MWGVGCDLWMQKCGGLCRYLLLKAPMSFNVAAHLSYTASEPGTMVLNIRALKGFNESLQLQQPFIDYLSPINRLLVVPIDAPGDFSITYTATADNPYDIIDFTSLWPTPVAQMNADYLQYLNPSRYCHSDRLAKMAMHLFGHIENEFEKVVQIVEWIHTNVEYVSGSTNEHTAAHDTIIQQAGVCRDFAHIGITFCRALNIPARYCSGYACHLQPPDFHACFEALLSGYWIFFDATKLAPLNGFVKIATGCDAADTAVSNIFGNILGQGMEVSIDAVDEMKEQVYYAPGNFKGLCYR